MKTTDPFDPGMPYTCGVCGQPRVMGQMHTCRTPMGDIHGPVPITDPGVYDKFRASFGGKFTPFDAEKYRRERLAEFMPATLFDTRPTRRTHIMKEILMLQPRGPRLLVKRIDAPKPASQLLVIPETIDGEASNYALVLAVGNKVTEDIKVADTVILTPYCGSPVSVELDGEMLEAQIVMEADVLGVVTEG